MKFNRNFKGMFRKHIWFFVILIGYVWFMPNPETWTHEDTISKVVAGSLLIPIFTYALGIYLLVDLINIKKYEFDFKSQVLLVNKKVIDLKSVIRIEVSCINFYENIYEFYTKIDVLSEEIVCKITTSYRPHDQKEFNRLLNDLCSSLDIELKITEISGSY